MSFLQAIIKYLKNVWYWLDAKSPDAIMEDNYERYGVEDPNPVWYGTFSRTINLILVALALVVPLILHIKFGSAEGAGIILRLVLVALAPLILLSRLLATINKKQRFAKSLPNDERAKYLNLIKMRTKKFLIVFILAVTATAIFIAVVLLVDKVTGGRGWL